MDKNVEFLEYIYQNTQMGLDTISQLLDIAEDESFKQLLEDQYKEYKVIFDAAEEKLKQHNTEGKDISPYKKVSAYIMINVKTLTDKTAAHIAEMLIQGSIMGVIDIIKNLKKYTDVKEDISLLGRQLLKTEESNVEQCKRFL
ncbi:hypothetical protein acsn021_20520 [Anaerocolumna cellulosilytica]|uniref:Uncharacterized protein n=1 Tax=Anaerocolumna cellulosilytica TaxID=433286 RepID=A0A6S6QT11_9FIRM|nr:hypothetical protein [Anaerocolumna cellulosilytica]MBB5196395.1 uncharacterized protein involved in tolerance to divalent cations [Anaerocolumna cellulosilytica]BCJ94483.1 hypothetical protein acsn021_20520 [Anaerocolumna cellulosilytica]